MFCKKLCCDVTIHLVTINFQSCIPYSVTPCIISTGEPYLQDSTQKKALRKQHHKNYAHYKKSESYDHRSNVSANIRTSTLQGNSSKHHVTPRINSALLCDELPNSLLQGGSRTLVNNFSYDSDTLQCVTFLHIRYWNANKCSFRVLVSLKVKSSTTFTIAKKCRSWEKKNRIPLKDRNTKRKGTCTPRVCTDRTLKNCCLNEKIWISVPRPAPIMQGVAFH
jgi:hypothetical protein